MLFGPFVSTFKPIPRPHVGYFWYFPSPFCVFMLVESQPVPFWAIHVAPGELKIPAPSARELSRAASFRPLGES